jgi:mRNA interferase MazF
MKRGDLVTIAVAGDRGQAASGARRSGGRVLRVERPGGASSDKRIARLAEFRVTVEPTTENGLRKASQVMIDRAVTLPRTNAGRSFGRLDAAVMGKVERALAAFLGLDRLLPG